MTAPLSALARHTKRADGTQRRRRVERDSRGIHTSTWTAIEVCDVLSRSRLADRRCRARCESTGCCTAHCYYPKRKASSAGSAAVRNQNLDDSWLVKLNLASPPRMAINLIPLWPRWGGRLMRCRFLSHGLDRLKSYTGICISLRRSTQSPYPHDRLRLSPHAVEAISVSILRCDQARKGSQQLGLQVKGRREDEDELKSVPGL